MGGGGGQFGRKVVPHDSKSDLPLVSIPFIIKLNHLSQLKSDASITNEKFPTAAVSVLTKLICGQKL